MGRYSHRNSRTSHSARSQSTSLSSRPRDLYSRNHYDDDDDEDGVYSHSQSRQGRQSRQSRNRYDDDDVEEASQAISTASSSVIDPNMPQWWNDRKKAERRAQIEAERNAARLALETAKNGGAGAIPSSGASLSGRAFRGKGFAGAFIKESFTSRNSKNAALQKKKQNQLDNLHNVDYMDVHRGSRANKKITADEELQGRSLKDLVDRGTLMVGCCLILVVVIAVTIPVALISEDEPYVAPPEPDPPTASPTSARLPDYWPIFDRLAPIAGGPEVLADPTTAQNRALNWIVYEDGMELGHSKDHLHQRFVLMVIYFISGPWTPVEGRLEWGSPVHECEWEGIFCKDVNDLEEELQGRVDELLEVGREDGIKIDVPQQIVNRLELRQRLVSGEVPAEFSLLYYLQHLDLENNQLVGALPTPLYKLFNLQTLFLEQNQLTNVDAIGEYRHLENLALSKNAFQGSLPESFRNLNKLKTLYLHTNAWTGQVFEILKDFKDLELLDIAFNQFEGTFPPELGDMKNLTRFFAGHNRFEGEIPQQLSKCSNLKEFQVDGSHDVKGKIPTFFGRLEKLTFLKLDTCAFTGVLPSEIGNLKNLTFLDVSSNYLEGNIPTELGGLESLVTLGLANNDFEGGVPSEFGNLKNLEKLYLTNTDLSGAMPQEVCDLRNRGNDTVLELLQVPCDVECDTECCTMCS
mmetsp:Transcript_13494/g.27578  ORF Transcript_13494/g.27578 Transcript_13494/m.27578 type:complete len:692 (+) Transcript_13494:122-2197(+)